MRSTRSLIQTIGRAARNVSGEVHMYADTVTDSMREAIDETERRRALQIAYNEEHGIDPKPLRKQISDVTDMLAREAVDTEELLKGGYRREGTRGNAGVAADAYVAVSASDDMPAGQRAEEELKELIASLTQQMMAAADDLQFELAARLRDELKDLKQELRQMQAMN